MPLPIKEPDYSALNLSPSVSFENENNGDHTISILNDVSNISISQGTSLNSTQHHLEKREQSGILNKIKNIFYGNNVSSQDENDTTLEHILNEGSHLRNEVLNMQCSPVSENAHSAMNLTHKHKIGFGLLLLGSAAGGAAFFLHKRNEAHHHAQQKLSLSEGLPEYFSPFSMNNISDSSHNNTLTSTHKRHLPFHHSPILDENLFEENAEYMHDIKHDMTINTIKKRAYIPDKKYNSTPIPDDVKIKKLTYCYDERESLSSARIMRIVSKTLQSPVSSLIKEGRIVLNYNVYGNGCIGNESFDSMAEKIESGIQNLLSSLPIYGRVRMVTLLASSLIDMIADAIENKNLSLTSASEVQDYTISLAKDLVISSLTKQFAKKENPHEIDDIIKSIKFEKNKMYLDAGSGKKRIEVYDYNHHITDVNSNGYLFYTNEKKWVQRNDPKFMGNIKKSLNKAYRLWGEDANIDFLQNSGPALYRDGLLINHKATLYSFVEDTLLPVSEVEITDDVFRYMVTQNEKENPIVVKQGKWVFEDATSSILTKKSLSFFNDHDVIRKRLIDKSIAHQDVGPTDLNIPLHYDKFHNKYIKIKNDYYALKVDKYNDYYLSGEYDVLPLKIAGNKYALQSQYLDGVYDCYREQLNTLPFKKNQEIYYLDNTILNEIKQKSPSWKEIKSLSTSFFNKEQRFSESTIPGALNIAENDYISHNGKLIKIRSNGDDTFILGYDDDAKNLIRAYKNPKSNTYFLMPDKVNGIKKNKNYRPRKGHCISKRQIFSLCNAEFNESINISKKLKDNKINGIEINDPTKHLDPYGDINGFYKKKNNPDEIYYQSRDGVFFHAEEVRQISNQLTPEYFNLYGKNKDGSIDKNFLIEQVCVIKDFDTHKMILSTPDEAMNTIFGTDLKMSKQLLERNKNSELKESFNIEEIKDELVNSHNRDDMDDVHDLFDRFAKKNIFSKHETIDMISGLKTLKIDDVGSSDFKRFSEIADENIGSSRLRVKLSIFEDALHKASKELNNVILEMNKSDSKFNSYFYQNTKINNNTLINFFKYTLIKKLKRMNFILDEKNKDNIIFIVNKFISKGITPGMTLGFSYTGDPLDRIFINSAVIPDDFNPNLSSLTDFQNREKYINSISNTMLHESVHATGVPFDFFYINTNESLDYVSLEDSLQQIENVISSKTLTTNSDFIYLCKLYFASNPIYNKYHFKSLITPDNLAHIFKNDDYFKLILLLNNPDSISHIIRDYAKHGF
ncbi:hypothetical protein [Candidatus Symbiopectobacterium sp. NZEC135]|uniref:hypothetical protein n=1 Tax=Candidatus Symbiopectobacterium sp. NZEC135 TaxID=2820471 RepID=UPI0022263E50|nr:hypothetical protein [Candidatus Symbiopectobacterium sp. NZEC135]MCW2478231.1 hypothetical protein [Candidatus Symbiopectobacterium sp. NZEC135]